MSLHVMTSLKYGSIPLSLMNQIQNQDHYFTCLAEGAIIAVSADTCERVYFICARAIVLTGRGQALVHLCKQNQQQLNSSINILIFVDLFLCKHKYCSNSTANVFP